MAIELTRRGFLQALGFGAVAAVAPALIEPRRKLWQVGMDLGSGHDYSVACTYRGEPLMADNAGLMRIGDGLRNANEAFAAQFNTMLREIGHEPYAAYDMPNGGRVIMESNPPVDDGLSGLHGTDYPERWPAWTAHDDETSSEFEAMAREVRAQNARAELAEPTSFGGARVRLHGTNIAAITDIRIGGESVKFDGTKMLNARRWGKSLTGGTITFEQLADRLIAADPHLQTLIDERVRRA